MAPLLILARQLDPLRRGEILRKAGPADPSQSILVLDLDKPDPALNIPHNMNLIGWRRFSKKHRADDVHFYGFSAAVILHVASAALCKIPFHVHLTGYLNPARLKLIRRTASMIASISCPTQGVIRQMRSIGISSDKIRLETPALSPHAATDSTHIAAIRRGLLPAGANPQAPLLLAMEYPANPGLLKNVAWAAALIRHAQPGATLIVSGPCAAADRERYDHWQQTWKTPELIKIQPGEAWDDLVGACDLMIASDPIPSDVIRLFHARQARLPFIAAEGPISEFCTPESPAKQVKSVRPRHLAAAVLQMLDSD
jgi:hypothetical protein